MADAEAWCAANTTCEGLTYNNSLAAAGVSQTFYFKGGVTLSGGRGWASLVKAERAPPGPEAQQVWVKRLGPEGAAGGAPMAVLCVNAGPTNSTADFNVSLAELGITGASGATVRNIWKLTDEPAVSAGGTLSVMGVQGHSSRFYKISPK